MKAMDSKSYRAWGGMIQRCRNPNNPGYKRYALLKLPVAPTPIVADRFAVARAQYPDAKLILLLDRRPDALEQYMLAVRPTSPWYELLPPEQICEIRATEPQAGDATQRQMHQLAAHEETILIGAEAPSQPQEAIS